VLETDIGRAAGRGRGAIGRLDGFMFTPDASGGSGPCCRRGAEGTGGRINARARLQAADDTCLATDGTVRWLVWSPARGRRGRSSRACASSPTSISTGAPRDGVRGSTSGLSHIGDLEPLYRLAAAGM
jgi:hypothetical protein